MREPGRKTLEFRKLLGWAGKSVGCVWVPKMWIAPRGRGCLRFAV